MKIDLIKVSFYVTSCLIVLGGVFAVMTGEFKWMFIAIALIIATFVLAFLGENKEWKH